MVNYTAEFSGLIVANNFLFYRLGIMLVGLFVYCLNTDKVILQWSVFQVSWDSKLAFRSITITMYIYSIFKFKF